MRSCHQFRSDLVLLTGLLFSLVLLLGVGTPAAASEVSGLFSAEVRVDGQSAEQRTEGIRRAFGQMLVKVTGNRRIAERSELQKDLLQAPRYVQQYRYRLDPGIVETEEGGEADNARLLMVQFDADAVKRLLRERRLTVWGSNRPAAVVWLGVDSFGQRRLLQPELDAALVDAMNQSARARGVPLILPLMDLEDQASVQVADLWGDFIQIMQHASERYSPDLIVTGRLQRLSEQLWRASWTLYQGERRSRWSDEGASAEQLATDGIQNMADLLAEQYAPVAGEGSLSRVRIRISGVENLQQYARLRNFLGSQSSVEKAELIATEPDAVTYDLQSRGGMQILEQGLSLGGVIEPLSDLPPADAQLTEGIDLLYRMR